MQEATTTFTMRLPKELKEEFERTVKKYDTTASQQIRSWIRGYLEDEQRRAMRTRK